jgi:hypothetical protein
VRHELAVGALANVDLEDVRTALDRGRERRERVLGGARGVAAMSDAEGCGDGTSG